MKILGINSFFEHPAVALIVDGELIFAIEDERLTRVKHGRVFSPYSTYLPYASIHKALDFAGIQASDIDQVAYSYNRWKHLTGSVTGCLAGNRILPLRGEMSAFAAASNVKRELREALMLNVRYRDKWHRPDFAAIPFREWDHHISHAASAFYCSGFESSLVVVSDGSGEKACTTIYEGRGKALRKIGRMNMPNSLGLLYSFVTEHLGFQPFGDEYKVMGLAAYGKPSMLAEIRRLVTKLSGGRYKIDFKALRQLDRILGPARSARDPITSHHENLARSLQHCLEDILLHVVGYHLARTKQKNLCVAGGTFLNCVANHKVISALKIEGFFAQPAAHDAGTAIGAAALSWISRGGQPQIKYNSMLLGTAWTDKEIEATLHDSNIAYRKVPEGSLASEVADLLHREKVVAYFQGRMEFGPRALGARSFLASPKSAKTRERLNIIKAREQFRPLAPIVTEEAFETYFEGRPNRYMMLAVPAKDLTKDVAPAVVHADGTSRAQTVRRQDDEMLHEILCQFQQRSGIPILVNTSLNTRGKPIDENPADALATAYCSGVDCLVIGSFVVEIPRSQPAGQ